jgi:DNA-binding CsgD family transcriptional regulator
VLEGAHLPDVANRLAGAYRRFWAAVALKTVKKSSSLLKYDASRSTDSFREGCSPMDQRVAAPQRPMDYDYRVRERDSGELELEALWALGEQRIDARGRCYEVLHARSSPCEHCPLRGPRNLATTIRSLDSHHRLESGRYELLSVSRSGADSTSVSVRRLNVATFTAMLQVRLDELAARAKLSDRERTVLNHLMQGEPIDEIAAALDIGMRTVKFHQANLLAKLGADSRTDLLRLLF